MLACRKGRIDLVRLLLDRAKNIDVYLRDNVVGNTCLHEAGTLRSSSFDVKLLICALGIHGVFSALHNHVEICQLLLSRFPKLAAVRNTMYRYVAVSSSLLS